MAGFGSSTPVPVVSPQIVFGVLLGVIVAFLLLMLYGIRFRGTRPGVVGGRPLRLTRAAEREWREKLIASMTQPEIWDAWIRDGEQLDWGQMQPLAVMELKQDESPCAKAVKKETSTATFQSSASSPSVTPATPQRTAMAKIAHVLARARFYHDDLADPIINQTTPLPLQHTSTANSPAEPTSTPHQPLQVSVLIAMPSPPSSAPPRLGKKDGEKSWNGENGRPYMLGVCHVPREGETVYPLDVPETEK